MGIAIGLVNVSVGAINLALYCTEGQHWYSLIIGVFCSAIGFRLVVEAV